MERGRPRLQEEARQERGNGAKQEQGRPALEQGDGQEQGVLRSTGWVEGRQAHSSGQLHRGSPVATPPIAAQPMAGVSHQLPN